MATAAQAAAHIFISVSRFRDLVSAGTITLAASGQYDLDKVREEYIRNLQRVSAGRGGEDGGTKLTAQRASLAHEQTMAIKFKNAVMRGDYVSVSVVQRVIENVLSVFRERIQAIPGKASDQLAARTRDEVDLILREELNEALDELTIPATFGGGARMGDDLPGDQARPASS